jgi:hypothetical protein
VPAGRLGQAQPLASTLNAYEGQVVANSATLPAGTDGAVSVYVTDLTDVIIDINGYYDPDDGVLRSIRDTPSATAASSPTFQTLYSSPGIVLQSGTGPTTDALMGIFFNAFDAGSQATRAVIAGRSGGNWGELSFRTQDGGDGVLSERMIIDSIRNVGIGTSTPDSKLTVVGPIHSTSGGFRFPDGTLQTTAQSSGTPGPQGPVGPQGPPGPQGPQGPAAPVVYSVCTSNATSSAGCSCPRVLSSQQISSGASCTANTSNSCTAASSAGCPGCVPVTPPSFGVCCVCSSN